MDSRNLSIKLLVDKKANKVLFAEANSDFVDFLFSLLSMPLSSVIKLLTKHRMSGSLANVYESVENLNQDYIQPNQTKASLLNTKSTFTAPKVPILMPTEATHSRPPTYYSHTNSKTSVSSGFVKGLISYMVTDDLVVTPMSTVSSITMLNKLNVDSVKSLEEKVINLGMAEGLELLKTSLQSDTVLSEVFLQKKIRKKK